MNRSVPALALLLILAGAWASPAAAECTDADPGGAQRIPVQYELKDSVAVIIGKAEGRSELREKTADPRAVTAVVFRVRVMRLLSGNIPATIDIREEGEAARTGLEIGKEYLMFVQRRGPRWTIPLTDAYFINKCGNSGPLAERSDVLRELTSGLSPDARAQLDRELQNWSGSNVLIHYRYALVDLNDDGVTDVVALLTDPDYCGQGGCELVVLSGDPDGSFHAVSATAVTREPVSVLAQKDGGWHALTVGIARGAIGGCEVRLQFDGQRYPTRATRAPCATERELHAASQLTLIP
jgi:hypothetical protein